ncbi:MAG: transporter substrate-binding domain-containing protein, partial [Synergistaceae bacterium]|nr:transporter substrate-binding domain-containing protein [Synergistaceae bacterium]
RLAADTGVEPFSLMRDNKLQGFDIELSIMFCKAKGYGLEIVPMSLSGILSAIQSGKCDFSIGLTWTEERAKTILFPPIFSMKLDNVLLIRKTKAAPVIEAKSEIDIFIDELKASFERTFIREERYKLFIEGIMNTMIITVLSIFFGMVLGFVVFMLCRTGNLFANIITKFSVWLIKGTPIVVLLMILYYIIFGKVDISGIWVAVIAFSLTFGTSVYRMLTFGTGALDRGQTEAAYALGYTDLQTFFTIILPQAALHFMPSLREEVTMLIKSTAVVGYIAVQDLTKMGDIVRSRTYEAFFPLIAVAIIYFILAGLLNAIVLRIHWKITPSMRKPEDILRGINLRGDSDHD